MEAAKHPQEAARLAALRDFDILDTPREAEFDEICLLASQICGTPISVVNLIDETRQWFKSEVGLGVRETPIETSICAHAILEQDFVEIPDAAADPRLANNPLVLGYPGLRFYAGALLKTEAGLPLGTLCVLDFAPRALTVFQRDALGVLSRQVMAQLELRQALKRQKLLRHEIDHRVKNSLASVAAVLRLQLRGTTEPAVIEALQDAETRVERIALLHGRLCQTSSMQDVDLAAYLGEVGEMLRDALPEGVEIFVDAAPIFADAATAGPIGVIVSEFVLNSGKHAFPDGRAGWVKISLSYDAAGHMELRCEDNGVGRAPDAAPPSGIGLRLMKASAQQLGCELTLEDADGFGVVVRMPLAAGGVMRVSSRSQT